MARHPIDGMKGAKPRLPVKPESKAEISKLSREYLGIRNRQMRTKALTAEMKLAQERGELIEKCLVEAQAADLLVALRQRILNVPQAYARRMVGVPDVKAAKAMLLEMAVSVLREKVG
jgi:hypothetical protein